eukprot:5856379-Pyramimonas_sp.AAC.1
MSGSVTQWPHGKKLLRDAQAAHDGFAVGLDLAKRLKTKLTAATTNFTADKAHLDMRSRVASAASHLDGFSAELQQATPLGSRYLTAGDIDE